MARSDTENQAQLDEPDPPTIVKARKALQMAEDAIVGDPRIDDWQDTLKVYHSLGRMLIDNKEAKENEEEAKREDQKKLDNYEEEGMSSAAGMGLRKRRKTEDVGLEDADGELLLFKVRLKPTSRRREFAFV